jgi:hypothetical protein
MKPLRYWRAVVKSVNVGNGIVFAFGGAATGLFISVLIGLVLLFMEYSETNVNLVKTSNWAMPIVGAISGGIIGMLTREESPF